jgi:putative membrane protein
MSTNEHSLSMPAKLSLRAVLNILLVWLMASYLGVYITITGGWIAFIILGSLLTLLNILVRPLMSIMAFPFKLFALLLTLIVINGLFVWLLISIASTMDSRLVTLEVHGIVGWIVVSIILGLGNWLMKAALT